MTIPFIDLKTQYSQNEKALNKAVINVLQSGAYIQGEQVNELESKLSDYVGVKHCVTCSSGTDALLMVLMAKGVGVGDAVFTTPFTFVATVEVIALLGATPIFVDVDDRTYNIDATKLDSAIQEVKDRGKLVPKAIISVDLFGQAADYDQINSIAEDHELFVLEDAAQAFGATYKGKKTCSLTEVGVTSFFPAKPLGCYGDGGAVFTNSDNLYEKLVSIRVHGQGKTGNKYDNIRLGLTARLDTIQAAVLLEKFKLYKKEIDQRNMVADRYSTGINSKLVVPYIEEHNKSVWAQYSILAKSEYQRQIIRDELNSQGIPTAVYYPIPIHLSKAYEYLGYKIGDFSIAENLSKLIFSLPMHPYLGVDDQNMIIKEINKAVSI